MCVNYNKHLEASRQLYKIYLKIRRSYAGIQNKIKYLNNFEAIKD